MTHVAASKEDEARWKSVLARDRRCDGLFVTGVHSTGIYCLPSCPARHPIRKNVRFYASGSQAEAAGLRPCKRCRPNEVSRDAAAVSRGLEILREAEAAVSLTELADAVDYSPSHYQRLFKREVGLTPAQYSRALRIKRAEDALGKDASVIEAIYDAGYESPSRFYEDMKGRRGMTASDWRDGGRGRTIHWTSVTTTLGPMLVAATTRGVCCLSFGEGENELRARFPNAALVEGVGDFRSLFETVVRAVEHPGTGDAIPLDVKGTAFQQRVWAALCKIPAGETRSYGQIAADLGKPNASRAVGGANGANNIAVLIPCHRVISADGTLGGYAYGEQIKRELIRREGKTET